MSIKHRKGEGQDIKKKDTDYTKSKHTRNNYKKFISNTKREELLKEYNKLSLLIQMMKVGNMKGLATHPKGADNIDIIKYKYNLTCQELTKRSYATLKLDYRNNRQKSL